MHLFYVIAFSLGLYGSYCDATYEQLFVGYSNVFDESIDDDVVIERGQVPEWLEGEEL